MRARNAGIDSIAGNVSALATQSAETIPFEPIKWSYATPAAPRWDASGNSFQNTGAQAGTWNHGMWLGFNAGRHSAGTVIANQPAIVMGFEDNYFDNGGDNFRGVEWYVEYWSPDGATVTGLRPFYTRIKSDTNTTQAAVILCNIGDAAKSGQFSVRTGTQSVGDTNIFTVVPTSITLNAVTTMTAGTFTITPPSGAGLIYINSPAATVPGLRFDVGGSLALSLVAQNAGRLQLFTGTGGLHLDLTGVGGGGPANTTYCRSALRVEGNVGFYNAALAAKQTVTGSRGGNAALASLLTALATVGLITDSSTA